MGSSSLSLVPPGRPLIGGRYELLHELASGGMATVHLARARGANGFERLVAIKSCHKHLRNDEEFAAMFLDEARIVSELHHSNIVGTLDFGEDPEHSLYIVMEFVDGYSLQQVQRAAKHRREGVTASVALEIVIDALQGLHAAHEHRDRKGNRRNIVHRDVSPQNILVGVDGVSRIMDFGIAHAEGRSSHTREGAIKGRLAYMPPEQHGLFSDKPSTVTARADIYSAGVVLWETLSGERLFHRDSDAMTVRAAMKCEVPPLAGSVPGVTRALDAVIARAVQLEPERRFATADEFVEALEGAGVPVASSREVSAWVRSVLGVHIAARDALLRRLLDDNEIVDESMPPTVIEARSEVRSIRPPGERPSMRPATARTTVELPAVPQSRRRSEDGAPPRAAGDGEPTPHLPPFRSSVAPPRAPRPTKTRSIAVTLLSLLFAASAFAAVGIAVSRGRRASSVARRESAPVTIGVPPQSTPAPRVAPQPPSPSRDEPELSAIRAVREGATSAGTLVAPIVAADVVSSDRTETREAPARHRARVRRAGHRAPSRRSSR
ncbi:MAG: protein kinase [Myxococcales bacterium]|nr:protein kinase [Myxococcales bacterium]